MKSAAWAGAILIVLLTFALPLAVDVVQAPSIRRAVRAELGTHCPDCDYDLRESPARCPECGRAVARQGNAPESDSTPLS